MYNAMKNKVALGMNVRTADGERVGKVTALRDTTFEIEKGLLLVHDYAAPFEEIARVDAEGVTLTVSKAELQSARGAGALGTSLSDRASGVVNHARAAVVAAIKAPRHE